MRASVPILVFALASFPSPATEPAAWKPHAADLLFASNRGGNSDVYVLRAGQKEWTNLTSHEAGDNWPVWSADGTRVAFQSRRTGNLDIWTVKADGSEAAQLTDDPEPDYLPAWSPDGRWLVYTAAVPGGAEEDIDIYAVPVEGGGKPMRLVQGPKREIEGSWRW